MPWIDFVNKLPEVDTEADADADADADVNVSDNSVSKQTPFKFWDR